MPMEGDARESVSANASPGSALLRGVRMQLSTLDYRPKAVVGEELAREGDRGQAGEGPSDRPLSGRERAFAAEVPVLPHWTRGGSLPGRPALHAASRRGVCSSSTSTLHGGGHGDYPVHIESLLLRGPGEHVERRTTTLRYSELGLNHKPRTPCHDHRGFLRERAVILVAYRNYW